MTIVYIRENFKRTLKVNSISGHSWLEHGETTSYSIIGASGVFSKHRTLRGAEKAKKELQCFYNKFGM